MKGSYYGAVKTEETPSTSIYAYPFGSAPDESNQMDSTPQSLNIYNWLNIIGYLTNFIVVGGLGNWFLKELPDNGAVSEKYQTIITPVNWAFAIWGPIFMLEAVFVIAQCSRSYRSSLIVQDGVNIWFFTTCILQAVWSIAFAIEYIFASAVLMIGIEISLVLLVISQYQIVSSSVLSVNSETCLKTINPEYLLLQLPFELHCGWITAATLLNINLCVVAIDASSEVQLAVAILSLGVILVIVSQLLPSFEKTNKASYIISSVLAWAAFGIENELNNPKELIIKTFDTQVISGVKLAALGVWVLIVTAVGLQSLWETSYLVFFIVRNRTYENNSDERERNPLRASF